MKYQLPSQHWRNRDLSEHRTLYLFCDRIYLRLRPDDERGLPSSAPAAFAKMVGKCSCMMFAVLMDASAGWHGVKMTPASAQQLEALRPSAKALSRLAA